MAERPVLRVYNPHHYVESIRRRRVTSKLISRLEDALYCLNTRIDSFCGLVEFLQSRDNVY